MQTCRAGGQLVEPLLRIVLSSSTNLEYGVHICNPALTRAEVWDLELEAIHPQLHQKFEISLCYIRSSAGPVFLVVGPDCSVVVVELTWDEGLNFILSLYIWEGTRGPDPLPHLPMAPDPGIWRHEPRVGGERLAAQPWAASVPKLLHGVAS